MAGRLRRMTSLLALGFFSATQVACDPVVNIAGANFPAWLLCGLTGAVLAAGLRPLMVATGIEPHLGPLLLIYPCLALLISCAVYLLLFNRI
jgi:YtcA family